MALSHTRVVELWRYYQAGIVNTVFGLGLYAILVRVGVNMYAAQLIAHLLGMAFNYVTYRRHVFRDAAPAKGRFVASYVVNYFAGLAVLALIAQVVPSPYLAGALTAGIGSVGNYFILRHLVFRGDTR